MRLFANIIWIVFGGWMIALEYILGGIALCVTVVGIPWGIQCFKLAILGFAPFGQEVKPGTVTGGCLFQYYLDYLRWLLDLPHPPLLGSNFLYHHYRNSLRLTTL